MELAVELGSLPKTLAKILETPAMRGYTLTPAHRSFITYFIIMVCLSKFLV